MLDSTDQKLMNLGTTLQEHGESEIGFFLSSIAVFRMAKALPLSEDVRKKLSFRHTSAMITKLPRVIFYCNEYGQAWWPGEHIVIYLNIFSCIYTRIVSVFMWYYHGVYVVQAGDLRLY